MDSREGPEVVPAKLKDLARHLQCSLEGLLWRCMEQKQELGIGRTGKSHVFFPFIVTVSCCVMLLREHDSKNRTSVGMCMHVLVQDLMKKQ